MKRIFWPLILAVTALWAEFAPQPYQTTLQEVMQNQATVADRNIPVGTSGIVLHSFDQDHRAIIATAIVTDKKDGQLTVTFHKFKPLRQPALPQYKIAPQAGDILILNYLYNRVLPIVPDESHYQSFTANHRMLDIVHPDLFAAPLYFDHEPRPTKKEFQKACRQNDLNLLYFAVKDQGHFVDCNSFKVIHSQPLATPVDAKTSMQPFYSRLPKIKNRLGGIIGGESIGDYNRYYQKLLGLEK